MSIAAHETTSKRIRWKAGKEDELWNYVQNRTAAGVSISEALKTFADKNGISWLTARWKYYRLKQDKDSALEVAEEVVPAPRYRPADVLRMPQPAPVHSTLRPDEAFEALSSFLSSASKIESLDLAGLLNGLGSMASAALRGEDSIRESATVRQQYNELQQQFVEYKRRLDQVRAEYDILANIANDWLDLHSVDRVTMMGDFAKKLQVQVEKVNRVVALAQGV